MPKSRMLGVPLSVPAATHILSDFVIATVEAVH